ncbi:hypothetical protein HDU97_004757 [Phlyctochytrium planicorne]|nr:hypothetical protein HDU97_004757 [Phlyctochytrium planicorne]
MGCRLSKHKNDLRRVDVAQPESDQANKDHVYGGNTVIVDGGGDAVGLALDGNERDGTIIDGEMEVTMGSPDTNTLADAMSSGEEYSYSNDSGRTEWDSKSKGPHRRMPSFRSDDTGRAVWPRKRQTTSDETNQPFDTYSNTNSHINSYHTRANTMRSNGGSVQSNMADFKMRLYYQTDDEDEQSQFRTRDTSLQEDERSLKSYNRGPSPILECEEETLHRQSEVSMPPSYRPPKSSDFDDFKPRELQDFSISLKTNRSLLCE